VWGYGIIFIALSLSNNMTEKQIIKTSKKWLLIGSIVGSAIQAIIEVVLKYVI
jgi:hypothetical protein